MKSLCDSCAKISCRDFKRLRCACTCGKLSEDHSKGLIYYICKDCRHEVCTLLYIHKDDPA